jgi:hypothetical protein
MLREDEIKFWSYVRKTDTCWLWAGGTTGMGYGFFAPRRSFQRAAHRLSYELAYGEIPASKFVCHTCDVPLCVRPTHLFLGTQADNMADKVAKGRQASGECNGNSKLTWAEVRAIRAALHDGVTPTTLASRYAVHRDLIYLIRRNRIWVEKEN